MFAVLIADVHVCHCFTCEHIHWYHTVFLAMLVNTASETYHLERPSLCISKRAVRFVFDQKGLLLGNLTEGLAPKLAQY